VIAGTFTLWGRGSVCAGQKPSWMRTQQRALSCTTRTRMLVA